MNEWLPALAIGAAVIGVVVLSALLERHRERQSTDIPTEVDQ